MFVVVFGILFGLYMVAALVNVIGVILVAVFSGAAFILAEAFTAEGIVLGIVIGLALHVWLKRRNTAKAE